MRGEGWQERRAEGKSGVGRAKDRLPCLWRANLKKCALRICARPRNGRNRPICATSEIVQNSSVNRTLRAACCSSSSVFSGNFLGYEQKPIIIKLHLLFKNYAQRTMLKFMGKTGKDEEQRPQRQIIEDDDDDDYVEIAGNDEEPEFGWEDVGVGSMSPDPKHKPTTTLATPQQLVQPVQPTQPIQRTTQETQKIQKIQTIHLSQPIQLPSQPIAVQSLGLSAPQNVVREIIIQEETVISNSSSPPNTDIEIVAAKVDPAWLTALKERDKIPYSSPINGRPHTSPRCMYCTIFSC